MFGNLSLLFLHRKVLPPGAYFVLLVAWVKYDMKTSLATWAGGLSNKAQNVQEISRCKGIQGNISKE